MSEPADDGEQVEGEGRAVSQRRRIRRLPPGKLDVIYIGGFPPVWQIWRRQGGMVTIQVESRESQHGMADELECDRERRKGGTMAGLANRAEQVVEPHQAEPAGRSGKLPPAKLDVIYIGGIPPLRQIWADFKAVVKARRESPPR